MLRLIGLLMLILMHRDTPAVFGPILGFFLGKSRHNLGIVLAALFQLFDLTHVDGGFEVPGQAGKIANRNFAGVEELMCDR